MNEILPLFFYFYPYYLYPSYLCTFLLLATISILFLWINDSFIKNFLTLFHHYYSLFFFFQCKCAVSLVTLPQYTREVQNFNLYYQNYIKDMNILVTQPNVRNPKYCLIYLLIEVMQKHQFFCLHLITFVYMSIDNVSLAKLG